jgi:hypothetical protein
MSSLLPTHPEKRICGLHHIAIFLRVLPYQYLPHQSGYDFFISIKHENANAMPELHILHIHNFRGKATSGSKYFNIMVNSDYLAGVRY